ncbi:hypothetical protein CALCODRAFT_181512 [Calocera cornea HHB12733]|uniref:Uncharacterized protein n=1 Tax=Calocera cornea HHB12733 TaxID=1353952 RepID=A0A165HRV8_9BASI|nr:hypothetical protein CALCODRAFT_181512 [Calocera cornea HHB12733]
MTQDGHVPLRRAPAPALAPPRLVGAPRSRSRSRSCPNDDIGQHHHHVEQRRSARLCPPAPAPVPLSLGHAKTPSLPPPPRRGRTQLTRPRTPCFPRRECRRGRVLLRGSGHARPTTPAHPTSDGLGLWLGRWADRQAGEGEEGRGADVRRAQEAVRGRGDRAVPSPVRQRVYLLAQPIRGLDLAKLMRGAERAKCAPGRPRASLPLVPRLQRHRPRSIAVYRPPAAPVHPAPPAPAGPLLPGPARALLPRQAAAERRQAVCLLPRLCALGRGRVEGRDLEGQVEER